MDNYKSMFESRISAGAMEKLPEAGAPGKLETNTKSSWSCDMESVGELSIVCSQIDLKCIWLVLVGPIICGL